MYKINLVLVLFLVCQINDIAEKKPKYDTKEIPDEMIESLINGETESDNFLCDYDRLLKMQEREGRAMSALATRMRLTQQSLVTRDRRKGGVRGKPPHMS